MRPVVTGRRNTAPVGFDLIYFHFKPCQLHLIPIKFTGGYLIF
jgi:hypothetical protein